MKRLGQKDAAALKKIVDDLQSAGDPKRAEISMRFFKTGKGEYGEGDVFIGISVPQLRSIAKRHRNASASCLDALLRDAVHEYRLLALLILADQFGRADDEERRTIKDFYVDRLDRVNNWDLVDSSAEKILGAWLLERTDRGILDELAGSGHLWRERVAIVATFAMIRSNAFEDTFRIAEKLLGHRHDLMHKAVGWMLREVGKRDDAALKRFLRRNASAMPRTALRYAIERFPERDRQAWLKGGMS